MEYYTVTHITYDQVFADSALSIKECLKILPRELSIRIGSLLASTDKLISPKDQMKEIGVFNNGWIDQMEKILGGKMCGAYNGTFYILSSIQTGLDLLKEIFAIPVEEMYPHSRLFEKSYPEIVLRVILLINSNLAQKSPGLICDSISLLIYDLQVVKYNIDKRLPLFASSYKMCLLFIFLANNDSLKWKKIGNELKKELDINSFYEYHTRLQNIIQSVDFGPDDTTYVFCFDQIGSKDYKWIKDLSTNINDHIEYDDNVDYTAFKSKPFIAIDERQFAITSTIFLPNLLYNSLYFHLLRINNKHKFFKNFPSTFNSDFTEKVLFYSLLQYIAHPSQVVLDDSKCKSLEESIQKQLIDTISKKKLQELLLSPPDGYIRDGEDVLLFECKGHTISKQTLKDKDLIKKDVDCNIVVGKGSNQLLRNAKKILQSKFLWDSDVKPNSTIYPILVVNDFAYSADGLMQYANKKNRDALRELGNCVMPLCIIDMDTLILLSEYLHTGELKLTNLLRDYYAYLNRPLSTHIEVSELMRVNVSFSAYLRAEYELKSPTIVYELFERLESI